MNIHELREAQARFEPQIQKVIEGRNALHQIRRRFVSHFTIRRVANMQLNEYVLGLDLPSDGYNFCYGLERQLDGLGRILGARSNKFGIYFGKIKSDPTRKYRFTRKFGSNKDEAFNNVKTAISQLLIAGREKDLNSIVSNSLSPMFKGKILATYYPDIYLNVFSEEHLDYFLTQFNLDTPRLLNSHVFTKRQALIDFKNEDPVMHGWPADIFAYFLYNYYPGRPPRNDQPPNDPLADYRLPDYPPNPVPSIIDLDILPSTPPRSDNSRKGGASNPDYEAEARKLKRLGDRGEKIVLEMEMKRLRDAGKALLATRVKKADFDYEGYDIRSFEEDGKPRYIEVKATNSNVGRTNFFLSANELKKATELDNYHIYMVFEILTSQPKVWMIGNPFKPENVNVVKVPVSYRISINSLKK